MPNNNRGLWTGIGSGAVSGAAAGTAVLPGWGTLGGAVIGGVLGAVGGNANDEQTDEEKRKALLDAFNKSQFGQQQNMDKDEGNKRLLGMKGLQYLASQRTDAQAQATANLRSFRNSITG